MVNYRHIFFDLDRTIWDFEKNSEETIYELLDEYGMSKKRSFTKENFINVYKEINHALWQRYRVGGISKDELRAERFHQSLLKFNIDEKNLALEFNNSYVSRCSSKTNLVPHSREILHYLSDNYILHIITNGFKEAQYVKLDKSGIRPFFKEVIVSDELGFNKPDLRIFNHALNVSDASLEESIMIGDDFEADILGAKEAGMDQVFYHPEATNEEKAKATYTVGHLEELRGIF